VAARLTAQGEPLGLVDRFYLYSPVIIGLMLGLFFMGNLSVLFPRLIPGYAYFSPWFWFASIVVMVTALSTTAIRARDWHLVPLVLPYLLFFTFHWVVVLLAAVMPVSWAHSKTVHGVEAERGFLPWLGIEGVACARLFVLVLTIALVWQAPLWEGLPAAPPPTEAPVLTARRSTVAWVIDAALAAGTVQGVVTRPDGKPLAGAKIELVASDGTVYTTKTNSRGEFTFVGIPPGPCTIEFNKGSWPNTVTEFEMPPTGGVSITAGLGSGGSIVIVPIPY
jgi:hypothetical protein